MNGEALQGVNEAMKKEMTELKGDYHLEAIQSEPHLYMMGNDAIGLGASSAVSKFMAAYPITPASEIMEYMIGLLFKSPVP
ncbi:hypothetical protein, partial [Streptococcus thoraltensis]